ncbi:MAG: hypothetical protein ACI9DF_002808 [Verrucomicrobiales bacterium]|jgi:hypothetical protein
MSSNNVAVNSDLPVIGWREWLRFPGLGIPGIKAKIDTGARSSALHTHACEVFVRNGKDWARFQLHPLRQRGDLELTCEAPIVGYRNVKNSGGHQEKRPFIVATAAMGAVKWDIELSLTNRESMKFRMLLGRAAIAGRFSVDPQRSYLLSKRLSSLYKSAG